MSSKPKAAQQQKASRRVEVSARAKLLQYAIRDVLIYAREFERKGKTVIYLNIGDPVKYGFQTPRHIVDALKRAVDSGANYYSPSEGIPELRAAIAEKEKKLNGADVEASDVIVSTGISEGISILMGALVNPGDEVLVPQPAYPPYTSFIKFYGGIPVGYRTEEEIGWRVDFEDLARKLSPRTKALVLINPNNPTGAVYDHRSLKQMFDFAAENDLLVVADEIYDRIIFDGTFEAAATFAKDVPLVTLNGFSKSYLMTGWRLGYLYFIDQEGRLDDLREFISREARVRLCANTPVQYAAVEALRGPQDHIAEMVRRLRDRRDFFYSKIEEMQGVDCTLPEGAFYLFPRVRGVGSLWKTDMDFVLELLKETGVLVVHGSGFDSTFGAAHFRGTFLPPIEILEQATAKMKSFMDLYARPM